MAAFPKTLGASVDLCYDLREKRLEAEKQIEEMKANEKALKDHIVLLLGKQGLEKGGSGRITGAITRRKRFFIMDRKAFGEYVIKTKQFELYEARPTQTACKERWENGVQIPGLEVEEVVDVSLTQVGGK